MEAGCFEGERDQKHIVEGLATIPNHYEHKLNTEPGTAEKKPDAAVERASACNGDFSPRTGVFDHNSKVEAFVAGSPLYVSCFRPASDRGARFESPA